MRTRNQGNFIFVGLAMFLMGRGINQNLDTSQDFYNTVALAEAVTHPSQAQPGALISYTATLKQLPIPGTYVEIGEGYYQLLETPEVYCCGTDTANRRWVTQVTGEGTAIELESRRTYPRVYHLGDLGVAQETLNLPSAPARIPLETTHLTERGRQEGLTRRPDAYYRGEADPLAPQLGDHRLLVRGLPSAETVTYFGSIQRESNRATPYEFRAAPYTLTQGARTRTLHHLINGDRTTALRIFEAEVASAKELKKAFDGQNLFIFLAFGVGGFACAVPLVQFLQGLSSIGQAMRRYGALLLIVIAGTLIAITVLLREMGVSALLATLAVGFTAVAGLAGSHRQQRRTAAGAAKALTPTRESEVEVYEETQPPVVDPDRVRQTFRNLVRLALEDDTLDEWENQFLVKWARERGIEDQEIESLFLEAKGDRIHGLEATSFDCFNDLIAVALLDGFMTDKERTALLGFGERLGMTRVQAEATIERLTQSFRANAS